MTFRSRRNLDNEDYMHHPMGYMTNGFLEGSAMWAFDETVSSTDFEELKRLYLPPECIKSQSVHKYRKITIEEVSFLKTIGVYDEKLSLYQMMKEYCGGSPTVRAIQDKILRDEEAQKRYEIINNLEKPIIDYYETILDLVDIRDSLQEQQYPMEKRQYNVCEVGVAAENADIPIENQE